MHNLRVTLHRVRRLLQLWGHEAALQTERQRIRLVLPSDLATLEDAITRSDGPALIQLAPWRLLEGFRLAGFESFGEWTEGERLRLTRAWGQACERALGAVLRAGFGDQAHLLFNAWHAQGLVTTQALARLHAEVASESAENLWREWQASAQEIEHAPAPVRALALMANAGAASLLCGRDAEQAALRGGRMAATLIAGEPGVGKTLLATAAFPGCPLMRCREGLEAVPYGPLAALLRHQEEAQAPACVAHCDGPCSRGQRARRLLAIVQS